MGDVDDGETFRERTVPSLAEFVPAADLKVGTTYYRVYFVDEKMLVPQLWPVVYLGEDLEPDNPGLYFQDAGSYFSGVSYADAAWNESEDGTLRATAKNTPGPWFEVEELAEESSVFHFDRALNQLLACSLRKNK